MKEPVNTLAENIVSGVTEGISGIGGQFDIQPSGNTPDETEYLRLPKKKKIIKQAPISLEISYLWRQLK